MPRRALVSLLAAVFVTACGGPSISGPPPQTQPIGEALPTLEPPPIDLSSVPARVHVQAPQARAAWVASGGESLSATADDGTMYRLDIPEGAIPAKTAITMTPIESVDDLGLSGGLAGGVYLQPAGLQLAATATLSITTSKTAPDGMRLASFDVQDDGTTVNLIPASSDTGSISIAINHFSAPGAAFGTSADLAALVPVNSGRLAQVMTELLTYDVLWDSTDKGLAKIKILGAWAGDMDPVLNGATDDAKLLTALADWRQFVFLLNLYDRDGNQMLAVQDGITYAGILRDQSLTSLFNTGLIKIRQRIQEAIDGNVALCQQSHDLTALANAYFWAHAGERYNPDEPGWLDRAAACAQIVLPVANLPTNLVAGGGDSVNLQFAVEFADGSQLVESFEVRLASGKLTFRNGLQEQTSVQPAQASLTESVSTAQAPPYEIAARGCWIRGGVVEAFCSQIFQLPFGAGPATTTEPVTAPPGSGGPATIAGEYTIVVSCNRLQYGVGSGRITQLGDAVDMTWTVTLNPNRDQAVRDGLCWRPYSSNLFPTSGGWSGTVGPADARPIVISLSSVTNGPCNEPIRPNPTAIQYGLAWFLPVGGCVGPGTPIQYRASWLGP